MKITASNTQQINQNLMKNPKDFLQDKSSGSGELSFQERLGDGLRNVAEAQKDAAQIAKNFESYGEPAGKLTRFPIDT
jgi:flagellar hook-basal body complex protein FliE